MSEPAPAPAPVVAPPPGNPRFPLLDSLRAVAALSVLVGHVAGATHITTSYWWGPLTANGDQGVTVFFILSGFLLYRPMVNARFGGAPPVRRRDYARRRLLRIVPAYWLALTVLAIYPGLPGVFSGKWFWYYGFAQVYNHDISIGGIVIAWSLCVEMSFYLLLPFYDSALARLTARLAPGRRLRAELGVLALLATGSLLLRYLDSGFPITLPVYMQWFAPGMALALLSAHLQAHPESAVRRLEAVVARRPGACWAIAAGLYVLLCALLGKPPAAGYSDLTEVLVNRLIGGVMAVFLVLPAVFGAQHGGLPRRVLATRWLAAIGIVSYGVYLWHLNLLEVIAGHVTVHGNDGTVAAVVLGALTAAAAIAVATVSYRIVERPLLRFKRGGAGRPGGQPAGASR